MTDTPTTTQATPGTTALAEMLQAHYGDYADDGLIDCECGRIFDTVSDHAAHLAAAVTAAIRGLSPDLQAELIGGEVQHSGSDDSDLAAFGFGAPYNGHEVRAVTPWTSVQPRTHTSQE